MIRVGNNAEPPPGMPTRCAACAYWPHFNQSVGVCRRRAPRPANGSDHDSVAHWPETYAEEGCGDGAPTAARPMVNCADCIYWIQGFSGLDPTDMNDQPRGWWLRAGRCTRYAPVPMANPGTRLVWPATHATNACGEGVPVPPPAG